MPDPDFLDTNVLVYAYDSGAPKKRLTARDLLRRALAGQILTSTQVLAEFSATLLHKLSPPATPNELIAILETLSPIKAIAPDAEMVRRAVEVRSAYGIHFYDGMIVAAAERSGARTIWSEDLNSGQDYFGIRVENPFA